MFDRATITLGIGPHSSYPWFGGIWPLGPSRLPLLQRRRRTCLQAFILPPSMVAIAAHLHIDHSLFHGREHRSFAVAGPRMWNRQINSYGQFRRHLKTHLGETMAAHCYGRPM